MLQNTLDYLRDTPATDGVLSQVPAEIVQLAASMGPAAWCPGEHYVDILRRLAAVSNGDSDRARQLLVESGVYVARTASNTFLRLLMKMLTPGLFAKKLPDIWKRDCTIGKLEVAVAPPKITCRFIDIAPFDHAACTGAGFLTSAFQAMGKKIEKIDMSDWSLQKPAPDSFTIELTWVE